MDRWNVGILIFEGVEVLDFAGPFEVFSRTRLEPGLASRRSEDSAPFYVFTVAKAAGVIPATGDLNVVPHYAFADAPKIDLLIVPGGFGDLDFVKLLFADDGLFAVARWQNGANEWRSWLYKTTEIAGVRTDPASTVTWTEYELA